MIDRRLNSDCLAALLLLAMLGCSSPAQANALLDGGKLLLTNGITTVEGSGGGGLATWATISGMGTDAGIGRSAHGTIVELPDYRLQSHGIAVGIKNRLELSYARQNFDTRLVGAALQLGKGYKLNQDVFGAKLRLVGDAVYGDPLLPQISIGLQHKRNLDGPVARAVGAGQARGTDYTLSATKLFLRHSVLVNTTFRLTKANQMVRRFAAIVGMAIRFSSKARPPTSSHAASSSVPNIAPSPTILPSRVKTTRWTCSPPMRRPAISR